MSFRPVNAFKYLLCIIGLCLLTACEPSGAHKPSKLRGPTSPMSPEADGLKPQPESSSQQPLRDTNDSGVGMGALK